MAQGDKIDDLMKLGASLKERVDNLKEQLDEVKRALKDIHDERKEVADLKTRAALFEHQLIELKKVLEESSRKRWSLVPVIVGAVVSGLISATVAYFVAKR
jgi:seryl-tRNA synthetase